MPKCIELNLLLECSDNNNSTCFMTGVPCLLLEGLSLPQHSKHANLPSMSHVFRIVHSMFAPKYVRAVVGQMNVKRIRK